MIFLSLKALRIPVAKHKKLNLYTRSFKINQFFSFRQSGELFHFFENQTAAQHPINQINFSHNLFLDLIILLSRKLNTYFTKLTPLVSTFIPFLMSPQFRIIFSLCTLIFKDKNLTQVVINPLSNYLANSHFYLSRSFNFKRTINDDLINKSFAITSKLRSKKAHRRLKPRYLGNPLFKKFMYIRFRWDFLNSLQLTWAFVDENRRIFFSSYAFKRKDVKLWSATKIFDLTPTWLYEEAPIKSFNSYIYSDAALYSRSLFIASSLYLDDDSYNEDRMLAIKPFSARRIFRNKKNLPLPLLDTTFILPRAYLSTSLNTPIDHLILPNLLYPKTAAIKTFFNSSTANLTSRLFIDFRAFKWVLLSNIFRQSLSQFLKLNLSLISTDLATSCFYDRSQITSFNNLCSHPSLAHVVERHFLKVITKIRHRIITTPWHISHMNRFFTFCTGKRSVIRVNGFIKNSLSQAEQALCLKWSSKIQKFRKNLGNFLFLNESLQILYLSFKLKDPYFFSNWLTKMFQRISFWKSRKFLSYIRYIIRHFFFARFKELKMKGVKFQLSGKISVAGNARTRTIRYKAGYTSQSEFDNKVLTVLNLIPSFTGVQGFKIWFFF